MKGFLEQKEAADDFCNYCVYYSIFQPMDLGTLQLHSNNA